jgi:plasmid stabilization system protein ParE
MTRSVHFHPFASRELEDAALWYEGRQAGLGSAFLAEVDRAVQLSAEGPSQFPEVHKNIRRARVHRFPYSVFFRASKDRILVIAVFHARRDPKVLAKR